MAAHVDGVLGLELHGLARDAEAGAHEVQARPLIPAAQRVVGGRLGRARVRLQLIYLFPSTRKEGSLIKCHTRWPELRTVYCDILKIRWVCPNLEGTPS